MTKNDTTDKTVDVGLLCEQTFYFALIILILIILNKITNE